MLVAQLSDSHLFLDPADRFDSLRRLERALDTVRRLEVAPDAVVMTGDCADPGTEAEYLKLQSLLATLPCPAYVLAGNRDHRARLLAAFGVQGMHGLPGFVQYAVDGLPVRLLALDTHVPGQTGGTLCDARLAWLESRLAEDPARPVMVFLHHQPFPTGIAVMDALGLERAGDFAAIVARHPQVAGVFAGHLHRLMSRRFHGTVAMTCPSVTVQVRLDLAHPDQLSMVDEPPGFLLHHWTEGAGLVTHLVPIAG